MKITITTRILNLKFIFFNDFLEFWLSYIYLVESLILVGILWAGPDLAWRAEPDLGSVR